jgi:hypothetical protein
MSATPKPSPVSWRDRAGRWTVVAVALIPLALTVLAEAAWVAIVANLINEYALHQPVIDLPGFVLFVGVGLIFSRLVALDFGSRWPQVALAASIGAAITGVLMSPDAMAALTGKGLADIGQIIGANPGGLMAGMALLRGIAWGHAGLPLPEDRLIRLLAGGLIVITLAAVFGALAIEPWRHEFLGGALFDGLLFAGAAMLALAFTRQAIAAGDVAAGWQRNPVWVVTLLVAVVTLVVIAMAVSGQVKPTIEVIIAVLAAPLTVVGLIAGWTRRGLRIFVGILVFAVILGTLGSAIVRVLPGGEGDTNGVGLPASPVDRAVAVGVAGSVLILIVLVILFLVRIWMRRLAVEGGDVVEERYVDRSEEPTAPARARRRRGFRGQPADAVTAYRALLMDISERYGVKREKSETPREHAERLRVDSNAGLPLNLLAADYALASFGEVRLTAAENKRAVSRWRLLRRRLEAQPEPMDDTVGDAL